MSTIVIFGGTGYSGGNIAREATSRGHSVISYSRHEATSHVDGVTYRHGSLEDDAALDKAASDADVLVVALHASEYPGGLAGRVPALIDAARRHQARLSFVGGAGSSLISDDGRRLLDTPDFLEEWKPEALAHAAVLNALRGAPDELQWFYVSPAALYGSFAPGETTGAYRTGGDRLVTKTDGSSEISGTDFALAYVDEIERNAHPRQRLTVGH
jgi:putative NADH-flavin reductase